MRKSRIVSGDVFKECHGRSELRIVGESKYFAHARAVDGKHRGGAFEEARPQQRVGEVRACLVGIVYGVVSCHPAVPKPINLRKNEPYPMRLLLAGLQFRQDYGV